MFIKYDVIIIGAGVAGLYAAINLNAGLKVLLLSKKELTLCNSALAQGGISTVLDKESDNHETHINDTLAAGGYENNIENLRILVEQGEKNIEELIRLGVNFDRNPDGTLALSLEGGHSRNRIVHHKDSTGYEIVTTLIKKVKSLSNVECVEQAHLLHIEKRGGAFFAEIDADSRLYASACNVIIATGGIGRVYEFTTNSAISTGDGIQFAFNLGAKIEKMNLIQFHPTAVAFPADNEGSKGEVFLITEAARGEGAYLYNKNMERFTDELAPRDVVAQSIIAEAKRTGSNRFYLDISHLDSEFVKGRFPMIYEKLLKKGCDFTKEPVPIYPSQHYLMGGITTDSAGRTNIKGLYAVGECAFTGVHGINRLASNSLLEVLVFSRLAAEDINKSLPHCSYSAESTSIERTAPSEEDSPVGLCSEIRRIMQKSFFVVPDYDETKKGLRRITEIKELLETGNFKITPDFVETKSLATIAYLVLKEVMKEGGAECSK
ncbi:MAG: FAD-binding protein [Oscillospiraceae bacterium]|nr:FAD-binding protein [Oscillospiraceae bacterium]